jgi:hypothetical protein
VINCTRFLSRINDLVPLPLEPVDIPRIPLISIAYRLGCLLDANGEKTSEHNIMNALIRTVGQWKEQGMSVGMCDFTSYVKLDVFPARYVIFLELTEEGNDKTESIIDHHQQQLRTLQNVADADVERHLCEIKQNYEERRNSNHIGPLICILVRSGTFSTFLNKELVTDRVSRIQIKPHRLLKNEHNIKFFYDHQISHSCS